MKLKLFSRLYSSGILHGIILTDLIFIVMLVVRFLETRAKSAKNGMYIQVTNNTLKLDMVYAENIVIYR